MPIFFRNHHPAPRKAARPAPAAAARTAEAPMPPAVPLDAVGKDTLALSSGPRAGVALPGAPALRGAVNQLVAEPKPNAPYGPSAVVRDHVDADAKRPALDAAAQGQLRASAATEAAAKVGMTAEQRAAYDRVSAAVAHDPVAQLDLRVLAAEGRLAGGRKSADGQDLLATLDGIAAAAVAEGVDKPALMAGMVRELAHPSSSNQQNSFDCAAATLGVKLALEQPAEYARLVGGLASPAGEVKLAGGETMLRARNAAADDGRKRTPSARLLQTAIMGHARRGQGFDAVKDQFRDGGRGLESRHIHRVASQLFGKPVQPHAYGQGTLAQVEKAANAGNAVPVGVVVGKELHEMLVMRADARTVDAINTQRGTIERYPRPRFERMLYSASVVGE